MTELERIAYAKSFIDKLANGINPLEDTPIPEDDIVNNVRLSRCFFYVSDLLRQVYDDRSVLALKFILTIDEELLEDGITSLSEAIKHTYKSYLKDTSTIVYFSSKSKMSEVLLDYEPSFWYECS